MVGDLNKAPRALVRICRWLVRRKFLFPKTNFGDCVFAFLHFVALNRRLPGDDGFNDKLYRQKISGILTDPLITRTTDKIDAKAFIEEVLGKNRVPKTLAVIASPKDIQSFEMPEGSIVKPAHGWRFTTVRRVGATPPDPSELGKALKSDHYSIARESNYRALPKRLIVEELVWGNDDPDELAIHCLGGRARLIHVKMRNGENIVQQYRTPEWKLVQMSTNRPSELVELAPPDCLDKVLAASEKLATHFGLVRIDAYINCDEFLIGEITHCASAAALKFSPPEADFAVGRRFFSPH